MASMNMSYIPHLPYNGTNSDGGDSLVENLNLYYEAGDIGWMIVCTALVLLMIPGVGSFYSGLARRKSTLSLIWLSVMATAVVSFQWFLCGYSLAFSHSASIFIGDLVNIGFRDVLAHPSVASARIPDILFAVYEGMFASITVALAVAAIFERGRILPCVVFMFAWSTLVYDPIAAWIWNPNGWLYKLGDLDFAGGTVVHISSGSAALAYSYALGKRSGFGTQKLNYRPQNASHIVLGTVFLGVGWFGFNAGSALSANLRAVMAAVVTNLSACVGGITWCLLDYRVERKWSTVGFCSGVVAGLVAITPGSGYVPPWAAIVFGVCGATICNFATQLKYCIGADDALDIFAVHAIGGLVGDLLTGIFAADYIAHLDGYTKIPGGWVNQNWIQPAIQLGAGASGMVWSFMVSYLILIGMSLVSRLVPALRLRVDEHEEELGIDQVEIGEYAYDYIELLREVNSVTLEDAHPRHDSTQNSHRPFTVQLNEKKIDYPKEIFKPISIPEIRLGFF